MKEKKQPPKQIKITNEVYMKLLQIGDESYSMTDRIQHLIDGQPRAKVDTVRYVVAQAVIVDTMFDYSANITNIEFYIINRSEIMNKVPQKLISLGCHKIHPEFFQDIKSWRCPIKVFLDNVIKSMVRDKIFFVHQLDPREYPNLNNAQLHNYALDTTKGIDWINDYLKRTYLLTAEEFLSTYKDGYSMRMDSQELQQL